MSCFQKTIREELEARLTLEANWRSPSRRNEFELSISRKSVWRMPA